MSTGLLPPSSVVIKRGKRIAGDHGSWYRHDTVVVDGKELEGFIQERRRYMGDDPLVGRAFLRCGRTHDMDISTCFRNVGVRGASVEWLIRMNQEAA
jgi:hypothetical protein